MKLIQKTHKNRSKIITTSFAGRQLIILLATCIINSDLEIENLYFNQEEEEQGEIKLSEMFLHIYCSAILVKVSIRNCAIWIHCI